MRTVDQLINDIIRREGGYVNHPNDKGGPTNWGITQATLAAYRGRPVSAAEVQALTQAEARKIYQERYFEAAGIDKLPEAIQAQAFDINVNGGLSSCLSRVTKFYEADWPAIVDYFGPQTSNLILSASRVEYYRAITAKRRANEVFLLGWLNRNKEFTPW